MRLRAHSIISARKLVERRRLVAEEERGLRRPASRSLQNGKPDGVSPPRLSCPPLALLPHQEEGAVSGSRQPPTVLADVFTGVLDDQVRRFNLRNSSVILSIAAKRSAAGRTLAGFAPVTWTMILLAE